MRSKRRKYRAPRRKKRPRSCAARWKRRTSGSRSWTRWIKCSRSLKRSYKNTPSFLQKGRRPRRQKERRTTQRSVLPRWKRRAGNCGSGSPGNAGNTKRLSPRQRDLQFSGRRKPGWFNIGMISKAMKTLCDPFPRRKPRRRTRLRSIGRRGAMWRSFPPGRRSCAADSTTSRRACWRPRFATASHVPSAAR